MAKNRPSILLSNVMVSTKQAQQNTTFCTEWRRMLMNESKIIKTKLKNTKKNKEISSNNKIFKCLK